MHHYSDIKEALGVDQPKCNATEGRTTTSDKQNQPVLGRKAVTKGKRHLKKIVDSRASYALTVAKAKKKSRKLPTTPRSRVRAALRQLYLRSRERAARLKLAGNSCERCGVKASKAKGREVGVQVHHNVPITNWEIVIDMVYKELLTSPEMLIALCKACHQEEHNHGVFPGRKGVQAL